MDLIVNNKSNCISVYNDTKIPIKPVIITSAHSGTLFTKDFFEKNMKFSNFFSMQDMFINDIVENLEYLEAPIIRNHISRVIIDLNRDKREINRKILKSFPSNLEFLNSLKAKAGIGLIPSKDSEGYEIYKEKLDWKIVKYRIENYYDPWHAILQKKIKSI